MKQAPRAWHDKITEYLVTIGFHMSDADHSLYIRKSDKGIVVITIYVDDLIVGGDSEEEVVHVKGLLMQKFEMKDLGELRYFLGIEVIRMPERIWLSHSNSMHWTCCPSMVWLAVSPFLYRWIRMAS
ncbi:reverse transcriptase domain-containing protein [Empedobacter sp. 189-2]|uniref:reverse transcriptase domain-containing protein n=1 Tax=Empedobacter sp. 189-2 TaxID=2746724 RepID=UPI002574F397|nr:reverse transcriptase domain-containing protein [Empedobacter sp. 189-2]MDM1544258.1 hypothetical protein [Empedobacter sp. 189-2]